MNQNTKLNGLILPAPLLDEINEASNYFGSCFESMIFNSIEKNLLDKDQKVITALNESFQKMLRSSPEFAVAKIVFIHLQCGRFV